MMVIPNDPTRSAGVPTQTEPSPETPAIRQADAALISFLRGKINNPLTVIVAEAQLIAMSDSALAHPELRAAADRIATLSHGIAALLRGLDTPDSEPDRA